MIRLHEVFNCYLLAGLKLKQFKEVLGEAFHLCSVSQGQQALGTHTQYLLGQKIKAGYKENS